MGSSVVGEERIVSEGEGIDELRAATTENVLALVWREVNPESTSRSFRIMARLGTVEGLPLTETIELADSARSGPAVAPYQGGFLVVWATEKYIYAKTIGGRGFLPSERRDQSGGWLARTFLPSERFAIFGSEAPILTLAMVSNGGAVAVVWNEGGSGSKSYVRGALIDSRIRIGEISDASNLWASPMVASDGRDFLIVWNDCVSGGAPFHLTTCRVLARTVRAEPPELLPTEQAVPGVNARAIDITSDGKGYLILESGMQHLYAKAIDRYGKSVGSYSVGCLVTDAAYEGSLTWDGGEYQAAWSLRTSAVDSPIFGVPVTRDGCSNLGVSISTSIPLTGWSGFQYDPRLLGLGNGRMLLTYVKRVSALDVRTQVAFRFIDSTERSHALRP